jgi:hypothetical protein
MDRLTYSNIVDHLGAAVPDFRPLVEEHIADNRAVLPHVLFGDLTRFVISKYRDWKAGDGAAWTAVQRVLQLLEEALAQDGPELNDLVKASFLENLGQAGDDYGGIRQILSAPLREALDRIYPE